MGFLSIKGVNMRKIEKQMLDAVYKCKPWSNANTAVRPIDGQNVGVFLHNNHIADVNSQTGFVMVVKHTLARWPTPTTKSRLRALGANVTTIKGKTFLDGVSI
tara:strand:- start:365 stop:673 length:309 start_codon:yes stop_codon:yes gene_type:complete